MRNINEHPVIKSLWKDYEAILRLSNNYKDAENIRLQTFIKILCNTLLDTLSKVYYPSKTSHRERLTKLIENHTGWDSATKVSIPHIHAAYHLFNIPKDKNYAIIDKIFKALPKYGIIQISCDIEFKSIIKHFENNILLQKTSNKGTPKIQISQFKHSNLFYNNRNFHIHELDDRSKQLFGNDEIHPYYSPFLSDNNYTEETFQLVYPTRFYLQLCLNSLKNISHHLTTNKIDIDSVFTFGDYLDKDLNKKQQKMNQVIP